MPRNRNSKKKRLRYSIIANYIGSFVSIFLAIIITPVYIKYLGIGAYGLIGFYLTLKASFGFLELGLGRSCNREIARLTSTDNYKKIQQTLRTFEVFYWCLAIVIFITILFFSDKIANFWLSSETISTSQLTNYLIIIGAIIAIQWPVSLYVGALSGLQEQVKMNSLQVVVSILNWGGAAFVIIFIHNSLTAFFYWQIFVAGISVISFLILTWICVNGGFLWASFSSNIVRNLMSITTQMATNSIIGTFIRQIDKLLLSALLPLEQFGIYALVALIARIPSMIIAPTSKAVYPRLSQIIGEKTKSNKLSYVYHLSCQSSGIISIVAATVIACYSYTILWIYTGDINIATNGMWILTLLAISRLMHSFMIIPFTLQLAYGYLKIAIYGQIISIIWLLGSIYYFTNNYGIIGPGISWILLSTFMFIIASPIIHRKLLPGEFKKWISEDTLLPLSMVLLLLLIVRISLPIDMFEARYEQLIFLILLGFLALAISILTTPLLRKKLISNFSLFGRQA